MANHARVSPVFLPHIFFEVNPTHILLVNISVCTPEKLGLLKKKSVTILLSHQNSNSNSLMSLYVHMICLNQNAHEGYPLQLVAVSFKSVMLI